MITATSAAGSDIPVAQTPYPLTESSSADTIAASEKAQTRRLPEVDSSEEVHLWETYLQEEIALTKVKQELIAMEIALKKAKTEYYVMKTRKLNEM